MRGRFTFTWFVAVAIPVLAAACDRAERVPESYSMAGVSARREFPVKPLRVGDLGTDEEGALYHRFRHRCSGCHVAPSPTQHQAGSWSPVVDRMAGHVESAGLLPIAEAEAEAIGALLERHAPRQDSAASQNAE